MFDMTPHVLLVRATACEFLIRKIKPLVLIFALIAVAILGLVLWLTTMNAWWWVLAVPFVGIVVVGVFIILALRFVFGKINPQLTKEQKNGVSGFVDKMERVTGTVQTPVFIIAFNLIRDIIRPRKKTYLQELTEDSTTLTRDFIELQAMFKN